MAGLAGSHAFTGWTSDDAAARPAAVRIRLDPGLIVREHVRLRNGLPVGVAQARATARILCGHRDRVRLAFCVNPTLASEPPD